MPVTPLEGSRLLSERTGAWFLPIWPAGGQSWLGAATARRASSTRHLPFSPLAEAGEEAGRVQTHVFWRVMVAGMPFLGAPTTARRASSKLHLLSVA